MDPDQALSDIADLLRRSAYEPGAGRALDEACQALYDWLDSGGFAPDWARHESAASYYRCREVHHKRGERVDGFHWIDSALTNPQRPEMRQFRVDDSPESYSLAEMLEANRDDIDTCERIARLARGETETFGGGAFATSTVTRIR